MIEGSPVAAPIAFAGIAYNQTNSAETYLFLLIAALNLFVGLLGFGFHVLGDLTGTQSIVWARLLYRNPSEHDVISMDKL